MTHDAAPPNSSDAPIDWEALARYLARESPAAEADRIGRWLAEHPGDADVVAALDNAMHILALRDAPGRAPDDRPPDTAGEPNAWHAAH